MADAPKTFAEWIAQNQNKASVAAPHRKLDLSKFQSLPKAEEKAGQNPLDWLIDIVSRPLYSMTNIANQTMNEAARSPQIRKKFDAGDALGGTGDVLSSILNIGTSGVRGAFSTDPEDHKLTSQLIEKGTDTAGKLNDPDYKDRPDNVDPLLKGVLGFVGDVGLDPLNAVPGTAILAGGKKLLSLTKLGGKQAETALATAQLAGEVTKGTRATANGLEDATEAVLKDSAKTPKVNKKNAKESAATKNDPAPPVGAETPTFERLYGPVPKAEEFAPAELSKFADITSEARLSPRAAEIGKGLDDLVSSKTFEVEVAKATKTKPMREKPLPFGAVAGELSSDNWLHNITDHLASYKKMSDVPKIGGESLAKLVIDASRNDPKALITLQNVYENVYIPNFAKAKSVGREVSPLGKLLPPRKAAPKPTVVQEVVDSVTALRRQVADDTSVITKALGPSLVNALSKMSNPEKLDATITRLKGILDGGVDLQSLPRSTYAKPERTLLDEIMGDGMGSVVPIGVRKPRSGVNAAPPPKDVSPEAMALVTERMGNGAEVPFVVNLANSALSETIFRDIMEIKDPSKWAFTSRSGTARTAELYGDGFGRRHREVNNYFQYTFTEKTLKKVSEMLKKEGQGRQGLSTAGKKQRLTMEALRLIEDTLDHNGAIPTIGVGADRIPLSMSQILHTLSEGDGHGKMQYLFWNWGTAVAPTALMDGVWQALKTGDRELVKQALTATTTRYATSDGRIRPMPNNLVTPNWGTKINAKNTKPIADLPEALTDLVMSKADALRAVADDNAAAWKARTAAETYDMSDETLKWIEDSFVQEAGFGTTLLNIYNSGKKIAANGNEIGATQKAVEATAEIVKQAVPDLDAINAARAVDGAKVMEGAAKEATVLTAERLQRPTVDFAQKNFEDVVAHPQDAQRFVPGGDSRDMGQKIDQMLGGGIAAKIMPIFSRRAGNELFHPELIKSETVFRTMVSHNANRVRDLAKAMDKDTFASLLRNVQKGVTHPDPAMADLQREVSDIWASMFGREGQTGLMHNPYFRELNNIDHINSVFASSKINLPHAFDMDDAALRAADNGTTVLEELVQQPAHWDIEDPAEFLNKAYSAFASVQVHQSMAQMFMKIIHDIPGSTSPVPKKGFTSITNASGHSILSAYLPNDIYIDDVITRQLNVVDNIMQDSIQWQGPMKDFLDNFYRPLLDGWKYGMTLPNPTHHIRNFISDGSLQFYSNGPKGFLKSYKSAAQAMATRNGYDGFDAIKYLQGMEELPNAGHKVAKGKLGELTADGLYMAAANRGNLPTFKVLENFEESSRGPLAAKWEQFTNTKTARTIGGVSEARDHASRLAHFAQFVDQNIDNTRKYKTLNDLLDDAAAQTRRWHPDGSDLTSVESGIFRLIIPFYSWQRKAIPLIIESVLTNPARVMTIPKGSYNLAVSMGVNPDSLTDPFPDDQMFPSYLTNQMTGPTFDVEGKYYGINPGFAANDILNDYVGSDPSRSVLGSVSPFIRAPFELASGGQVGTGARINDPSDYIDSNTPGLGQISRMTGNSVSGSVLSMLTGQGLDPQYQVAQGNKEGIEAVPILNWLTGMGITPMSQPNQINYAEIEKRNKEGGKGGGF